MLNDDNAIRADIDFDNIDTRESSSSQHPRKSEKKTPQLRLADLDVFPKISVREWLQHSNTMILYDWFPLTYFTVSSLLAPYDTHGCKAFGMNSSTNLMYWVYGPILVMRFIGMLFFNKRHLIIWQIVVIYGY